MLCFVFPLQAEKHHPALVKVLCAELGVEPEALLDFELCLTDTQPAVSVQINQWWSASADNPVLLPEGLESHHTKQQLRMMLIMLVQSFLITSYQVDVIVPRFCFPPSGTGRRVWRVHFLSSSWQPPQLLLRPAGWDATLEFDNEAIFFLYIAFSEILITSLIAQTPVKHLQFFKGNVVLAWTFLCVTCVRGWCNPAQERLWLTIPTSEWSLCLIMKRWDLFKFSYLSSLK